MKCGDKNSKLFHHKATTRRKRNGIRGLFDETGSWRGEDRGVEEVVSTYFEDIFRSSKPDPTRISEVLAGLEERVTTAMNRHLLSPFEEEDVKTALFSMDPIKAPGLDGFPALFYQKNWAVVGERLTTMCLGVLNDGLPVTELNDTLITLILKSISLQR